jgi:hypothetical protein
MVIKAHFKDEDAIKLHIINGEIEIQELQEKVKKLSSYLIEINKVEDTSVSYRLKLIMEQDQRIQEETINTKQQELIKFKLKNIRVYEKDFE